MSSAKDIIGKGRLLILGLNRTQNSAERCWASAAEPPFPQIKTFLLFFKVLCISLIALLISFSKKKIFFFKESFQLFQYH